MVFGFHKKSHETFLCKIYDNLLTLVSEARVEFSRVTKIEFLQWLPPIAVSMHSR
jgi:hypothetical protein